MTESGIWKRGASRAIWHLLSVSEPASDLKAISFAVMRPVTSIVVAVLLAFIVVAFVAKLLTGGLTP